MSLETVSTWKSHGGVQGVYRHDSHETGTAMTFSVFVPPQAAAGVRLPVVFWLSGLTSTHINVVEKGGYRRACAELGLILVAPDTSPRGEGVPTDPEGGWDFGLGAGFYLDAAQAPYAANYRMGSYVAAELPRLIGEHFPVDIGRKAISGFSMGGHGALVTALRNPGAYRSVSAFAPISTPSQVPWGRKAFSGYLGQDREAWAQYDACELIARGHKVAELLVDQGDQDSYLENQLRPDLLQAACAEAGVPLTLRMQPGYDHSYYFVSTFIADHLRWHAERLV
ncbi:MAG: S-formylglutathione hydrolase [Caulobacteraceae bacterium]